MDPKNSELYIKPDTIEKPWGSFRQFSLNQLSTVKILHIKEGEEFSLQNHTHRAEFWRILKGQPIITIGDKKLLAKEGDEFMIPVKINHRATAKDGDVDILEISFGKFDEGDIKRIVDKYGRV